MANISPTYLLTPRADLSAYVASVALERGEKGVGLTCLEAFCKNGGATGSYSRKTPSASDGRIGGEEVVAENERE
ncbi:hypothetical protein N7509_011021 [Penicillium cosmopolitanum]|uniref:Uncharacterized protein n=1 Tax=Penicillium cosmopolitanum TaxID=1131564 RepID=A0A9W9VSR9_9EURO|nr:uncharacterized protein N7509_011021 [Penicillium cosmopolitanum]KAJ5388480.1 hypothetical protein N7509_011021 [Penicillium cosmopolitanum]